MPITLRLVKGTALTFSELDGNFVTLEQMIQALTAGNIGYDNILSGLTATDVQAAIDELASGTPILPEVGDVTHDLTGFTTRSNSTIEFDNLTRTLTFTAVDTVVWSRGQSFILGGIYTLVIPDVSGQAYILFNTDTMELEVGQFHDPYPLVALLYWDAANQHAIVVGDERHSSARDTTWHMNQHTDVGAIWRSGGVISYTLDDPDALSIGLTTPLVIADEDLVHTIVHSSAPDEPYEQFLASAAELPVLYLDGTSYVELPASNVPWVPGVARARYNLITGGLGTLADADNNHYISYWLVATNDMNYPVKLIMGRANNTNLNNAYAESLESYGIPLNEFAPLYQIVLRTANGIANTPKVVIAGVRKIAQQSISQGIPSAVNHDTLSGRELADQHPMSAITGLAAALAATQDAANLTSGVVPDDRLASVYTKALLENVNGQNGYQQVSPGGTVRTIYGLIGYSSLTTVIGAIVLSAPAAIGDVTTYRFELVGQEAVTGKYFKLSISFRYDGVATFSDLAKLNYGTDVQVRVGLTPTGRVCLILGAVGTSWESIQLTSAIVSIRGPAVNRAYSLNWTSALVTDLTGYTSVSTVPRYDIQGLAYLDVQNIFTVPQRFPPAIENSGSFNFSTTHNFVCTPAGPVTLQYSVPTGDITGQSGFIKLYNPSGYTITASANFKIDSSLLSKLSTAGNYLLAYFAESNTVVNLVPSNSLS